MKITVDKTNISDAIRKDSHHCMIADAIKDAVPNAQFIVVDLQTIKFSDPDTKKRKSYLTPPVAQGNLLKFDAGESVKPFSFNLIRPISVVDMHESTPKEKKKQRQVDQERKARERYARKQSKKDPVYLASNRARNYTRERAFGLRLAIDDDKKPVVSKAKKAKTKKK